MRKLLALLMGLNECASAVELKRQYQRLISLMLASEAECKQSHIFRYQTARERLSVVFEKTRRKFDSQIEMHGSVTGSGLLLGELLVDAEIITEAQLENGLKIQAQAKPPLPLGRILVACKLLSWEELAYFLKLQDLLQLPPTHPHRLSRQLLELGLLTKAELEVAELDCETTGCSMFYAISARGWIKPGLLAVLANMPERKTAGPQKEESTAGRSDISKILSA